MSRRRALFRRTLAGWTAWAPLGLAVASLPFVLHASRFGWLGMMDRLPRETHLASPSQVANAAIFLHMLGGAVLTLGIPLQVTRPIRARFPVLHRWVGVLLACIAVITAIGGLTYIALRGTIGGPYMNVGFGLYGLLVLGAALQTARLGVGARRRVHGEWAVRFLLLALGSWFYRIQYGLWYLLTEGYGMAPAFQGPFDRVMCFAFYVPHLLAFEAWRAFPPRSPVVRGAMAAAASLVIVLGTLGLFLG